MKPLFLSIALLCVYSCLFSQSDSTKTYTTAHVIGDAPEIDGNLNDKAWENVEWAGGDFRQNNPDPGKPASVQTKFKILYDAKNLYVAVKALDPDPSKIVSRMSRRDGFDGDFVEINIDSYYDKRTAFSFTASVSGVKGDEYVSNNGDDWDASWDPIWYLKTSIDNEGWIAEMRIPLSQLRFAEKEELVWGVEVTRFLFRNQERSVWQYIPPNAGGWVHLFGELRGIKGVKPQKQLEVQPYVVGRTESLEKEEGNPYMTGNSSHLDVGLDAKIGVTSDITLDLTVNPDFGQVEADPSQVNLTAFELFFQERRPFFIEGSNTLNFPANSQSNNNLFYSRRIGRAPQGGVATDGGDDDGVAEYVKPNNRTTILGAAKLTGKNKNGFSWALLESVTSREFAEVDSLGHKRNVQVEPLTNYLVSRAQQDINKGNTVLGGMFTATNRKIETESLNWLHKDAYSAGVDFLHHWRSRKYYLSSKVLMSRVGGSTEAIANTQLSSERYFQRPDNDHTKFDPTRKSLTGTGGQLIVGKKSGNIVSDLGVTWSSPELELNDVGFLAQTDIISQWFWMQFRQLQPKGITRWRRFNINQWREFDFGGRNLSNGYNINTHFEFKNFWRSGGGFNYNLYQASNADLRGGPTILYPGNLYHWFYVGTDQRKQLRVEAWEEMNFGQNNYVRMTAVGFDIVYRPLNALNITISPSLTRKLNRLQYVSTVESDGVPNYIIGEIDQTIARVVFRATYVITPNMSLQYYGQPFGASGHYSNFKYVADADAEDYEQRFKHYTSSQLTHSDGQYFADHNSDGTPEYNFSKPDFNFGQFRSNMVLRWEYIPGSTFFLVWTQERNGAFYDKDPGHDRYSLDFQQKAHNVFLIKYTYRFVL
jgi:hypothetical protein